MTVAEQVISVFTGVKGYLDDVDLSKIKDFENWIRDKKPVDSIEDVTFYKVH